MNAKILIFEGDHKVPLLLGKFLHLQTLLGVAGETYKRKR